MRKNICCYRDYYNSQSNLMRWSAFVLGSLGAVLFLLGCQGKQVEAGSVPDNTTEEVYSENKLSESIPEKKELLKDVSRGEKRVLLGRNPFLTLDEEKEFSGGRKIINYLTLSAVFYAPGHSYAIIDGHIVKEKDTIDNKEIIRINPESVILRDALGAEYIVRAKRL